MLYYIKDYPLFGENFVDGFIEQCLDEFIPDILIQMLKKGSLLVGIHIDIESHYALIPMLLSIKYKSLSLWKQ